MLLKVFMTTVKEYKRFADELPVNHESIGINILTNKEYVYENVRLMLLRKYIQTSRSGGDVYIPNIIAKAESDYPEEKNKLDDILNDYRSSCEPALKHFLSDGTERTLSDSINDIIYGLYLHGDKDKIERLSIDDENLRNYCIVLFVKEIERILFNLYDLLNSLGVQAIEQKDFTSAPVLSFDSDEDTNGHISGSPYWSNIKGKDLDEAKAVEYYNQFLNNKNPNKNPNDILIWLTAYTFTRLLDDESSSIDLLKQIVCKSTLTKWGDFSDIRKAWKKIDSPGISSTVRYNNKNEAYVYILPKVIKSFAIESKHQVTNIYKIILRKETETSEWKIFSFVGKFN